MEQREPLCTIGGNADCCNHCGKQYWRILKKFKMDLHMIWQFHFFVFTQRDTNSKRYMHSHVHCILIYNSQGTEATYVFITGWLDQVCELYTYIGILFSHKKGNLAVCNNMDSINTEWSKLRERQILLSPHLYVESKNIKAKPNSKI